MNGVRDARPISDLGRGTRPEGAIQSRVRVVFELSRRSGLFRRFTSVQSPRLRSGGTTTVSIVRTDPFRRI